MHGLSKSIFKTKTNSIWMQYVNTEIVSDLLDYHRTVQAIHNDGSITTICHNDGFDVIHNSNTTHYTTNQLSEAVNLWIQSILP